MTTTTPPTTFEVQFNGQPVEGFAGIANPAEAREYALTLALEHAERIYPLTFADRVQQVVNFDSVHYEFETTNGSRPVYAVVER